MAYTHNTEHCLSPHNKARIEALCETLSDYERMMAQGEDPKVAPIINLCKKSDDLAEIESIAAMVRGRFSHVIICGSGGSGLSGKVLCNLQLFATAPHLHFLDNADPEAIEALLANCPPEQTYLIAISKSGSTVETLSQFYTLFAHFSAQLGARVAEHCLIITMPGDSPLRSCATQHGLRIIDHPTDIGGRFSLFTSVGLVPAAIKGLAIAEFRKGADSVSRTLGQAIHPARMGAALQYEAMERGHNMSVMFPYCERLLHFSSWYRQSWAESLGKAGKGTTPIPAMGTSDQHSQLQLYLAGPKDKFFTLVMYDRKGMGTIIPVPNVPELAYLKNKTTGDVMAAEQKATLETLVRNGRPVRVIQLQQLNEYTLGALLMHCMLEVFFMARLLEVDAFDQPAVEEGKILARDYLLHGAV